MNSQEKGISIKDHGKVTGNLSHGLILKETVMETYTYDTKVTNIDGKFNCRLFRNGKLVSELQCYLKEDIGWCFREMLRWQDKLGFISKFASAARERQMKTPNPKGKYIWVK